SKKKPQKQFRNGYEVSPQALSFVPYKLEKKARKRAKPFSFEDGPAAKQPRKHTKVTVDRWNKLAREAGVLPVDATLREFQIQCANLVLQAGRDICVIAPTGAGKSMLWCLPVLAQPRTISLVITPYTSLGEQGEADMNRCGISSIFINADQNSETDLQNVARGVYKVVFICVESVETPRFARVLYSKTFKEALQGIYIDEAHLVKESLDWRPGYQRLGQLRTVVGRGAPLVAISATLPSSYRSALCTHAGLGTEHHLINLGNFRNELSLVVRPLQYSGTFQDLAFTVPTGASSATIVPTLVYYDDTLKLTDMLWWYQHRLQSAGIPDTLVDIIHAGLSSTHQERALNSFREGRTKILLATEKIGAGIHLPRVERVVQYLARNNLTLAKLDQRRGRGARTRGMTAICYFLVEPELIGGDPSTLPEATDPGILALVRADGCYQDVLDHWLENPIRQRPFTYDMAARLCCSHCQPDLAAIQEYQWIAVDP
ncbi:P-loop containing nucleoside triphosphate hydrolase protein, partial [Irpex lacteus]